MRVWVIIGIIVFAVVLVLTLYNVIFQGGPEKQNNSDFPNTVFQSLGIDTLTKYGIIAFTALALCFFIWGFPRKK